MLMLLWLVLVLPIGLAGACSKQELSPVAPGSVNQSEGGAPPVKIETLEVDYRGHQVHGLEAGPTTGLPVLLLHGAAFHSGTWVETGTIETLASKGYRVVAIDLPGFGKSKDVEADRTKFLAELLPELAIERPVVVSPSMSGMFAFPLVLAHPEMIRGFVPVAPAAIPSDETLGTIHVPTLIFWGEKDTVFPVASADRMAQHIPGSKKTILAGARHPCYLDAPKAFHETLLAFLSTLKK